MDQGLHKIVIVTQPTRLAELTEQFNTVRQAKFYVESLGGDFADCQQEDACYRRALEQTRQAAEALARVQVVPKSFLPNLILGRDDVVIALGRDGLVANVMKYLDGHPLIGVNPEPQRWEGRLLPFRPGDLDALLPRVLQRRHNERAVTMAVAKTRDGQTLYAANDFFLGIRDHRSARYEIEYRGRRERQCSSGVIISTGLGMSGWHASVMAQLRGMAAAFKLGLPKLPELDWADRRLRFTVREPFPSPMTGSGIVCGELKEGEELIFRSDMPADGVLFSDGMAEDAISFPSGMEVRIRVAERVGHLVV